MRADARHLRFGTLGARHLAFSIVEVVDGEWDDGLAVDVGEREAKDAAVEVELRVERVLDVFRNSEKSAP